PVRGQVGVKNRRQGTLRQSEELQEWKRPTNYGGATASPISLVVVELGSSPPRQQRLANLQYRGAGGQDPCSNTCGAASSRPRAFRAAIASTRVRPSNWPSSS